jgi:hypothetical protein
MARNLGGSWNKGIRAMQRWKKKKMDISKDIREWKRKARSSLHMLRDSKKDTIPSIEPIEFSIPPQEDDSRPIRRPRKVIMNVLLIH